MKKIIYANLIIISLVCIMLVAKQLVNSESNEAVYAAVFIMLNLGLFIGITVYKKIKEALKEESNVPNRVEGNQS